MTWWAGDDVGGTCGDAVGHNTKVPGWLWALGGYTKSHVSDNPCASYALQCALFPTLSFFSALYLLSLHCSDASFIGGFGSCSCVELVKSDVGGLDSWRFMVSTMPELHLSLAGPQSTAAQHAAHARQQGREEVS